MTESKLVLSDFPETSNSAVFYPESQANFRILQIWSLKYFAKWRPSFVMLRDERDMRMIMLP